MGCSVNCNSGLDQKIQETGWAQIEQNATKGVTLLALPFIDIKYINRMQMYG